MSNCECRQTICNNGTVRILHNESGTCISNTSQLDADLIRNVGKSLENQEEWKVLQIRDTYNSLIESSELIQMIQYILPSSVLTLNILKHSKAEIELNNQVLYRLKKFMSLVDFISTYHKDKKIFLGKWKHIFNIFAILANFKDNCYTPTNHICVDLYQRVDGKNICTQENQSFGSIVFIDSNSRFTFKQNDNFIGLGIINKSFSFSDSQSSIPVNIFGISLVRVVYPKNNCVDERGMFVILNKNQEENIGIGEIISFGDLITREADSFHLVGICSLDKTEQSNSLFLFSTPSRTSRITHPSNDFKICFVSMISLPMSDSLVRLLLQSTILHFNNKTLLATFFLLYIFNSN